MARKKSYHLIILLAVFQSSCSQRRIKDGKEVTNDKQYVVYLLKAMSSPHHYHGWLCGGAIISKDYVITSAACVQDVQHLYVIPGYKKYVSAVDIQNDKCIQQKKKKVILTCVPKSYQFEFERTEVWSKVDIALVKVESPFNFKDTSYETLCSYTPKTIKINTEQSFPKTGDNVIVFGWGHSKEFRKDQDLVDLNQDTLHYASTTVLDEATCVSHFQGNQNLASFIASSMICTLKPGNTDETGHPVLRSQSDVQDDITNHTSGADKIVTSNYLSDLRDLENILATNLEEEAELSGNLRYMDDLEYEYKSTTENYENDLENDGQTTIVNYISDLENQDQISTANYMINNVDDFISNEDIIDDEVVVLRRRLFHNRMKLKNENIFDRIFRRNEEGDDDDNDDSEDKNSEALTEVQEETTVVDDVTLENDEVETITKADTILEDETTVVDETTPQGTASLEDESTLQKKTMIEIETTQEEIIVPVARTKKPPAKPAAKPPAKQTTKPPTKPPAKPPAKPTTKQPAKQTTKPTTKQTTKPTTKPATKPTTKQTTEQTTEPTTEQATETSTETTTETPTETTTEQAEPTTETTTEQITEQTTEHVLPTHDPKIINNQIEIKGGDYTPGICQNDHGGPLVAWKNGEEVLVAVATLFKLDNEQQCMGPYLFTKTYSNAEFINCIVNDNKNDPSRRCDDPETVGFEILRRQISWVGHKDGPADNEQIKLRHQKPISAYHAFVRRRPP